MDGYFTVKEYAQLKKVTTRAVIKWCTQGKVKGERFKNPRGGHPVWMIPIAEVSDELKAIEEERLNTPLRLIPTASGNGNGRKPKDSDKALDDRSASVSEANRLLKIEQAIKLRDLNKLRARTLVDFDELANDFETIIRVNNENMRDLIEKWGLKYAFAAALTQEMIADFEKQLQATRDKLLKLLERT